MLKFRKRLSKTDKSFSKHVQNITGLKPKDINYYKTAFTHSSAAVKDENGHLVNNERLEFLGDALLNSIIGEYLYKQYPRKNEGFLTKLRSKIVSREFLDDLALKLQLDTLIISRVKSASQTKHIYGNCLEALIGALYLDQGYRKTKAFIINKMILEYVNLEKLKYLETNFKSALIEWGQKHQNEIQFFTSEDSDSKQHQQTFTSTVKIDKEEISHGHGQSKKEAEQQAAKRALKQIRKQEYESNS